MMAIFTLSFFFSTKQVSACDVSPHSKDQLRLDITIPGEAYLYVRAADTKEKQKWLVALGSSKANADSQANIPNTIEEDERIKGKKSELKLYCDLLIEQAYKIRDSASTSNSNNLGSEENDDQITDLDEMARTLNVTCDNFVSTLEELMNLAVVKSGGKKYSTPKKAKSPSSNEHPLKISPSSESSRHDQSHSSTNDRPSDIETVSSDKGCIAGTFFSDVNKKSVNFDFITKIFLIH